MRRQRPGALSGNGLAPGARGEAIAARYLEREGYRVLERNFRTRRGEIDIVAQSEGRLVFVEVKSWRVLGAAELGRSVGPRKQSRIRAASRAYLMLHPELEGRQVGYDVVFLSSEGGRLQHYQNAFDGV